MLPRQLAELLEGENVSYEVVPHERAYTAQGVAAALHVSGRDFAKAVMVKSRDGRLMMAVVPGPRHVDLAALGRVVGVPVELAREEEFAPLFPGCELGAEPPLGNLYGVPVYVDEGFVKDAEILFNAGTHTEAIRMKYADYARLVHPAVGRLSTSH